jgi:hypothetical protein
MTMEADIERTVRLEAGGAGDPVERVVVEVATGKTLGCFQDSNSIFCTDECVAFCFVEKSTHVRKTKRTGKILLQRCIGCKAMPRETDGSVAIIGELSTTESDGQTEV